MNNQNLINRSLLLGAKKNDVASVKESLANGADMYFEGALALAYCVKNNNVEMIQFFVDQGFDLSYNGEQVYVSAVRENNYSVFQYLCSLRIPSVTILGAISQLSDKRYLNLYSSLSDKDDVFQRFLISGGGGIGKSESFPKNDLAADKLFKKIEAVFNSTELPVDQSILLIGGPGTGKTFLLLQNFINLIKNSLAETIIVYDPTSHGSIFYDIIKNDAVVHFSEDSRVQVSCFGKIIVFYHSCYKCSNKVDDPEEYPCTDLFNLLCDHVNKNSQTLFIFDERLFTNTFLIDTLYELPKGSKVKYIINCGGVGLLYEDFWQEDKRNLENPLLKEKLDSLFDYIVQFTDSTLSWCNPFEISNIDIERLDSTRFLKPYVIKG